MELQLDIEYERQRRAMLASSVDAVEQAWLQRDWSDRDSFLGPAMDLVDSAAAAYVQLLSAYYNARAEAVTSDAVNHDIDSGLFSAAEIRPEDPEFLNQAYGTLIHRMERGKDFTAADKEAAAYVRNLTSTHLQAVQVRAASLWMATL